MKRELLGEITRRCRYYWWKKCKGEAYTLHFHTVWQLNHFSEPKRTTNTTNWYKTDIHHFRSIIRPKIPICSLSNENEVITRTPHLSKTYLNETFWKLVYIFPVRLCSFWQDERRVCSTMSGVFVSVEWDKREVFDVTIWCRDESILGGMTSTISIKK